MGEDPAMPGEQNCASNTAAGRSFLMERYKCKSYIKTQQHFPGTVNLHLGWVKCDGKMVLTVVTSAVVFN